MIDESLRGPFYRLSLPQIRALVAENGVCGLAERTLEAIDRINPRLNAFVHLDRDRVLAEARALDQLPATERGPLHGIPIGVKDLIDVAGWPMTAGSRVMSGNTPGRDAAVITRLRAAGALVVGMTLTHEFAYGTTGDVSSHGAAHNPHRLTHMTGASSAGSGAAAAAGLVPLALGSDTGGSIRVPAALCGVFGVKPGHGEVSIDGVQALAPSLDHVGVLAHDSDLAWLAMSVLSGRREPEPAAPQWSWLDIDRVPLVDPRIATAVRGMFDEVSGHSTLEVALGNWPEMRGVAGTIMSREAWDTHAHQLDVRKADYAESTWERIDSGRHIGDEQYADARRTQRLWRDTMAAFLDHDQVLVCPTAGILAPEIGVREMTVGAEDGISTRILTNLTVRWNLVGFPAVSVPAGEIDGLPFGMQIIAKPGSESALRGAVDEVTRHVRGASGAGGAY
ncbi:amidase [Blastococcus sp. Marseille-P5729]|uniref:amidase n=1 Tax=Blastococcus sp. Marseille-P5729 TaxID=2086582 RepID=UPI000D112839|nr:amidase [Blastococcus sp. Marseille-P5729]